MMADDVWHALVKRAQENGFTGGVSELLERLGIAELKRKRGIAHLQSRILGGAK